MIFRTMSTKALNYGEEDFDFIKNRLPELDPIHLETITNKKQRDLALLMLSVAICNTVQPCFDTDNNRFLQSSSPDEIALVTFAEQMGFFIKHRDRNVINIKAPFCEDMTFDILKAFPFSSAKKRMGIILQEQKSKKIFFFLKGADTAIKKKVSKNGDMIVEEADNLAREGLRTLAFCYRSVTQKEYDDWKKEYNEAVIRGDEKYTDDVVNILESGMIYIGLTGVEDLLQVSLGFNINRMKSGRRLRV